MRYVLATLSAGEAIPQGAMLHRLGGHYNFYPFPHDGPIWTIDPKIWRACTSTGSIQAWFALDTDSLINITRKKQINRVLLGAIVDNELFHAIGHMHAVRLPSLEKWQMHIGVISTQCLGFDVIDITGMSALTNIGFLHSEVAEISRDLTTNKFGLFSDASCAARFAEFANRSAPEHAPFVGVQIVSINNCF